MFENLDLTRFRGAKVGIATGGDSPEREISLATGKAFQKALEAKGYDFAVYDIASDLGRVVEEAPAVMLLGVHGGAGESGALQGFLESLKIPYTGSGVLASALAMDKKRAKVICEAASVKTAGDLTLQKADLEDLEEAVEAVAARFSFPLIAKLNDSGSSVGVHLCEDRDGLQKALKELRGDLREGASSLVLVEEFLEGPEYSVGSFDGEPLGVMEIVPGAGFYDFAAKYERDDTVYRPVVDKKIVGPLEEMASAALQAVGCRGVARVDFKGEPGGARVWGMLELNTIPGMTATSLVPKLARNRGVSFEDFVEAMVAAARLDEI